MNPKTISILLVLFLGTVWGQESGEGALEGGAGDSPDTCDDELDDSEEMEALQDGPECTKESEGIQVTGPKECGGDQGCRYLLFPCGQSFNNAQRTCRSHGGQLASIHNSCTNSHIQTKTCQKNGRIKKVWIGVYRPRKSRTFVCVDGSRLDYTNWSCKKIGRCGRKCAYLNTRSGRWGATRCRKRLPFICRV